MTTQFVGVGTSRTEALELTHDKVFVPHRGRFHWWDVHFHAFQHSTNVFRTFEDLFLRGVRELHHTALVGFNCLVSQTSFVTQEVQEQGDVFLLGQVRENVLPLAEVGPDLPLLEVAVPGPFPPGVCVAPPRHRI